MVIGDNRTELKVSYKESKEEGLAVFLNPPYTPQPRGIIEKAGMDIISLAKAALVEAGLPEFLWPWACKHSSLINNILPSHSNEGQQSPANKLCDSLGMTREDIKLDNLYTFGCRAYVLIPKELYS